MPSSWLQLPILPNNIQTTKIHIIQRKPSHIHAIPNLEDMGPISGSGIPKLHTASLDPTNMLQILPWLHADDETALKRLAPSDIFIIQRFWMTGEDEFSCKCRELTQDILEGREMKRRTPNESIQTINGQTDKYK